jgi:SsrA-binding protein
MTQPRRDARDLVAATNRKARHDYEIEKTWEAGLVLTGSEVKSLRAGAANLGDGYVLVRDSALWLLNVHIQEYTHASRFNHEPMRPRKLLLHLREIEEIVRQVTEKSRVCVPLSIYFKNGRAKVEIGTGVGKKLHDKRHSIKEREANRELQRVVRAKGAAD